MSLRLLIVCIVGIQMVTSARWPIPAKKYPSRPADGSPYCQVGDTPFCADGFQSNTMPTVKDTDELYVYAMKVPIWKFKLTQFKVMHDAIGFHHVQSGLNMTMEWDAIFQFMNCTFPHEPEGKDFKWCNQGATCISPGIDADRWKNNGTLVRVATINGTVFNQFANWTENDNNTYPIYQTWTVRNNRTLLFPYVWFEAMDSASWVIRAFEAMHGYGAKFDTSIRLEYTNFELISKEPIYLGNDSSIRHHTIMFDMIKRFYSHFQNFEDKEKLILYLLEFLALDRKFYFYFNEDYYLLPLEPPFLRLRNHVVRLPW